MATDTMYYDDDDDDLNFMMRNIDLEVGMNKAIVPTQDPEATSVIGINPDEDDLDELDYGEEDDEKKKDGDKSKSRHKRFKKNYDLSDFHTLEAVVRHVVLPVRLNSGEVQSEGAFAADADNNVIAVVAVSSSAKGSKAASRVSESRSNIKNEPKSTEAAASFDAKHSAISSYSASLSSKEESKLDFHSLLKAPWEREARNAMLVKASVQGQGTTKELTKAPGSGFDAPDTAISGKVAKDSNELTPEIYELLARCGIPSSLFADSSSGSSNNDDLNMTTVGTSEKDPIKKSAMDSKEDKADEEEEDEVIKLEKESLYSNLDKFAKSINYAKVRMESTRQKAEHITGVMKEKGGMKSHHETLTEVLKNTITKQKSERSSASRARRNEEIITSALSHAPMVREHRWCLPDLRLADLKTFHRPRWFSNFLTDRARLSKPINAHSNLVCTHSVAKISIEQKKSLIPLARAIETTNNLGNAAIAAPVATLTPALGSDGVISLINGDIDEKSLSLTDGDFLIIEYVEENPPMLQNYGMASKILNYHRRVMSVANDRAANNSDKTTNESIDLIYSSNLPPHVKSLYRQKNNQSLYVLDNTIPRLAIGDTIVLEPEDDSPFVGDVEEQDYIVPTLVNRMFKTPIFNHKPNPNIFLLILDLDKSLKSKSRTDETSDKEKTKISTSSSVSANTTSGGGAGSNDPTTNNNNNSDASGNTHSGNDNSSNNLNMNVDTSDSSNKNSLEDTSDMLIDFQYFKLRKIPISFLAGQLEPSIVVPPPGPQPSEAQIHFCNLVLLREFHKIITGQAPERYRYGVSLDDVRSWLWSDRHHSKITDELLHSLVLKYASYNHQTRTYRPIEDFRFDENDHINMFTPEDICLYQSSLYSDYKLKKLHITKEMDIGKLIEQLAKLKDYHKSFELAIAGFLHGKETLSISNPSEFHRLEHKFPRLDAVLRFQTRKIHRMRIILDFLISRLAFASWNISGSFSKCVLDTESKLQMSIQGHGDPSGIGEAICYIPKLVKKDTVKKQVKVAGTDNDLRVLSNEEQFDILCNNFQENIEKMKKLSRWDRITLIKYLCSHSEEENINLKIISKFSRLSGLFGKEMNDTTYIKTCKTVWKKQQEALQNSNINPNQLVVSQNTNIQSLANIENIMEANIRNQIKIVKSRPVQTEAEIVTKKRRQRDPKSMPMFSQITVKRSDDNDDVLNFFGTQISETTKADLLSTSTTSSSDESRPKIVKTIKHVLTDDNKIKVIVRFTLDPREVERVTIENQRKAQASSQNNNLLRVRTAGRHEVGQESPRVDPFGNSGTNVTANKLSLNLKISRAGMTNTQQAPAYFPPSESFPGGAPGGLVGRRGPGAGVSSLGRFDIASEEALAIAAAAKRRGELAPYYARLPRVGLASVLEEVLLLLYSNKNATIFREPVDRLSFPSYYEMIMQPICLQDMLRKIHSFSYNNVKEFMDDLNLMVNNCIQFNGATSDFSKFAKNLRDLAGKQLNYGLDAKSKKNSIGVGGDSKLHLLQEAIVNKDNEFRLRNRQLEIAQTHGLSSAAPAQPDTRNPSGYNMAEEEGDIF